MWVNKLKIGLGQRLSMVFQAEAAECGLACVCMLAQYHGYGIDLQSARVTQGISLKGATLKNLMGALKQMKLGSRAIRLEASELRSLQLPCVLHWDFNHFVVLSGIKGNRFRIHDPASGIRDVNLDQLQASFTGVALEVWPNADFVPAEKKPMVSMSALFGTINGAPRAIAQLLSLSVALEILGLISPLLIQWVLDNVLLSDDKDLLIILVCAFLIVLFFTQALKIFRSWVVMAYGATIAVQWKANMFGHLLGLPVSYFQARHVGDVLSRFGAIDSIQATLTTSFISTVIDGAMSLIVLGMMFLYSPTLSAVSCAAMLLYGVARGCSFSALKSSSEEHIVNAAKQQSHFLETIRAAKTIKVFGGNAERQSRWLSLLVNQLNAGLQTQRLQLLCQGINGLIFGIENIVILYCGALLVMDGSFTVGMLMAFIAYKTQFDSRLASFIDRAFEFRMLRLHTERLADIALCKAESDPARAALDIGSLAPGGVSLELEGVSFRYAKDDALVLDNISFKIDAGESVCITGPSGTGKTSLMNVLLAINLAESGKIFLNGRETDTAGLIALREVSATVMQDDVLLGGSILDNITFFDDSPDRSFAIECATLAAVHTDVLAMPMGYNTLVGDMGTVLSGGQKQRVILARALYRRPKVLFLDEATSHLDIAKEFLVNESIKSLHITRLIIAHRLETILSADKVVVMDQGRIRNVLSATEYRQIVRSVHPESFKAHA